MIRTRLLAGTLLAGLTIAATACSQPDAEVPEVVGLTFADAGVALAAAGFEWCFAAADPTDGVPETTLVVSSDPPGGTWATEGSEVVLFTEVGPDVTTGDIEPRCVFPT